MQKRSMNIANIDEFISGYPANVQKILQKLRQTIQKAAPQSKETISYGIPTFTLGGKNLVHFSAYEHHIGFYPGAQAIIDFARDLKVYKTSKGTVQFPLDKPIPHELIDKITRYCATAAQTRNQ